MEKKVTTSVTKALIISLILIVVSLITQFAKLQDNKALGFVPLVVLLGGIIWSATSYASQMNGDVTFGNVFAHAFKTAAAVTAITVVFTFISLEFINPEMKEIALQKAREQMESQNRSDDQINTIIEMTRKNFILFAVGGQLLSTIIIGLISALIGAAVAKKRPADPFVQQG